jgi:tetratricopeptide (TPR) repeat protein
VQTSGKELLADPGLDPELRLWSLWLISDALRTNGQYREALTAIENELAERREEDADAWNRPLIYTRQASVHETLWDYDSQMSSLNLALESARDVGNVAVQGDVLNQLSRALVGQGDLVGAADHAIQALRIARTIDPPSLELARACAVQIMQSFGSADPRLADTFHAEARALTRGDDTTRIMEVDTAYAAVLSSSARFEHAHRALDGLSGLLSDLRPIDRITVQMTHANLLDAEGRQREAVQENRNTVEALGNSRRDRWPLAAALTNAATTEMGVGDMLDEAVRSAETARDLWTQLGDERGVILSDVVQAEVFRRRGKYEAARVVLGDHSRLPGPRPPLEWLLVNAELELDVGRLDVAAKHLSAAVEESLRCGERGSAVSAASRLLGVQLRAGDLAGAEQSADRVYELMGELRTLRSYRSTAETELANQHNGRAVRQLIVSSLRPIPAVRDAVQHLEEAIHRDVGSCWYSLNLAYAHGKLGDKKSMKRALDAAIGKAEGSLFGDPIARLAAEFPM